MSECMWCHERPTNCTCGTEPIPAELGTKKQMDRRELMNEELCEKLKVIADALDYISPTCNNLHIAEWRHEQAALIRQAISLLRQEGMVVVPKEPTRAELREARQQSIELLAQVAVMARALDAIVDDDGPSTMMECSEIADRARQNLPKEAEKLVRLVAVVDELLAWDKKHPKGTVYSKGAWNRIEDELTDMLKSFRDLRGEK